MSIALVAVSFDCADAETIARFWAEVLGRPLRPDASAERAVVEAADGPMLIFHKVPEGKTVKNRVHPDLVTADYETERARLIGLGATKLWDLEQNGRQWTTFTDPAGNEFDLIAG